ncbi:MAG: CorA family divalent cation transporter [Eubacteriales bacterium]|nr:CorA family divalent cation transporter [Eubacteriales bacterium]
MKKQWNSYVEIWDMADFEETYPDIFRRGFGQTGLKHIRFCKADRLNRSVIGTFAIPGRQEPAGKKRTFGYCLMEGKLLFVEETDCVRGELEAMDDYLSEEPPSAMVFLFELMEFLVKDDVVFLQQYEERLTKVEEELLRGETEDFEWTIFQIRRELSALSAFYEQLSDMGETLQQYAAEREAERDRMLFGLCADRAGRLYSTVQMMKEYVMQIREMQQSRIDVRQNQVMKMLTIVTTVFMPLSLIAGWYGMNFSGMPELKWPYGYPLAAAVCLAIVAAEIWIFKKKKWM